MLLMIAFHGNAPAATLVQTFTDQHTGVLRTSTGEMEVVDLPFNFSQAVMQFDPALGTLTSIVFDMSFDFRLTGNSGAGGGNISGGVGGTTYLSGISYSGAGGGWGDGDSAGNPLLADFNVANVTQLEVGGLGDPAHFTNATGTGTVLWEYKSTDSFGLDFSTTGTASGEMAIIADTLEVTYIYTPVPEASAAMLLACGLGLAIARRRRK